MKQKAAGRIEKEVLLTVSDPVAVQNIEVGGTPVLSLFDVDVIPNEIDPGKGVVRLGIDAADIPEEGVHGLLVLTEKQSKQTRHIPFSAILRPPFRVLPSVLVVQRASPDDGHAAFGILVRNNESQARGAENEHVAVTAMIAGERVPVELEAKGGKIKRLKFHFNEEMIDVFAAGEKQECTLDVMWGSERSKCSVVFQLVRLPKVLKEEK